MASTIRILFGTETGNAEDCANELRDALTGRGWRAEVVDMDDYAEDGLVDEALLLIVTSTFGNGDPPVNAEAMMAHVRRDDVDLTGLRYGVCALGDATYPRYAQCGRDFDRHLEARGGQRVIPLSVCDADFEKHFPAFQSAVIGWLEEHGAPFAGAAPTGGAAGGSGAGTPGFFASMVSTVRSWFGGAPPPPPPAPASAPAAPAAAAAVGTARNPATATLLRRRRLSGDGSNKETMHYELAVEGLPLVPGDSVGVHPENDPAEVAAILDALDLDASAPVQVGGHALALEAALRTRLDLQRVTGPLADAMAVAGGPAAAARDAGDDALREWRGTRFVAEALSEHPGTHLGAQALVDALRPLPARLYSVANSPLATPGELHLTVETLRWTHDGFARKGVASTWLCDRLADGQPVRIHRVPGDHFRLPDDGAVDVICVGPGTGIAPFRAFLQHREARGDTGRTWLIFGHQTSSCDALYAADLAGFQDRGVLTQLTCAWSRDQADKVYVQHRLAEHGAEVWAWLDGGAVFYVCGDKVHMAGDVRDALVQVAIDHGGLDADAAGAWVAALEADGRYRVDVY